MIKTPLQSFNNYRIKVFLLVTFALLAAPFFVQAKDNAPQNAMITVHATGESRAKPDMAVIDLSVITYDETAQKALATNNETINNIITAFKNKGIQENDLKTSDVSIEQLERDKHNKMEGNKNFYQVSNYLTVRIRNLANAGVIFDQAIGLGANSVNGITFINADAKPFYEDARKKAVAQAIKKAETLAQAANLKLGKIVKISESDSDTRPALRSMMKVQNTDHTSTNFSSGELGYNVSVTIVFSAN